MSEWERMYLTKAERQLRTAKLFFFAKALRSFVPQYSLKTRRSGIN